MLTWQDPVADPAAPAPAGAWHETIETPDVGGAILHAPVDAPSGLRGTFAIAASRAPGVTVTVRDRFDADRRQRAVGRLRGRRPARAASDDRGRAPPARRSGPPSRRPSSWRPASAGRSGSRSPGTCPSSSSGPGGAGGSATRATGAGPATRAFDLATHALERDAAPGAPRSRPGSDRSSTIGRPPRLVQGGALQRALLPGRRRHVLGGRRGRRPRARTRRPGPVRAARVPRLPVLRHASTSTSTRRSRSCGSSPSSRRAGIRDLARGDRRSTTPRSSTIEASGAAGAAQGRRHGAARRRRAGRRPVLPPEPLPLPGRQRLEGPRPEVRAPGLARRGRRSGRRRRPDPRRVADGRGPADAARTPRPRRRRPARARRPARPDLRHLADARPARLRRRRSGWARWPPPRRWPAGSARPRPRGDWARLVRARPGRVRRGGSGAAATTPTTTAAAPSSDSDHGRPARRPVVRRRDRPRRPPAAPIGSSSALRTIHG